MRLEIDHRTTYRFVLPVGRGLQRLRLTPTSCKGQVVREWRLGLTGAHEQVSYDDENGNRTTLVSLDTGAFEVVLHARGTIETSDEAGVVGRHTGFLPLWHFLSATDLTTPGAGVAALVAGLGDGAAGDRLSTLHALTERVRAAVTYEEGHTGVTTSAEAALAAGHGICQDHAHVFIAAARQLGVPARYVSGYLAIDGRIDQDAGHGWAEAFVDGLGWVGFDVANAICPDGRYVRVATGRDYRDAAPVKGMVVSATGDADPEEALSVAVAVRQLAEV